MNINNILDYIFTSPGVTTVLRELNLRTAGITGREMARLVQLTHRSTLKALSNLELLNLVKRRPVGRAYYFTLNREHFLYNNIISSVFKAENDFKSEINKYIKKILGKYSESIIVFGSVAREEETFASDLDVCIVYSSKRDKIENELSNLRLYLFNVFGVSLAPYLISATEFIKKAKNNKPPVNNIIKEGKIIHGTSLRGLIYGKAGSKAKHRLGKL